jgi:hypothetical protein
MVRIYWKKEMVERAFIRNICVRIISIGYIIEGGYHRQPRERRKRDQEGKL